MINNLILNNEKVLTDGSKILLLFDPCIRPVPTISISSGANPTCEGLTVTYRTEVNYVNNWHWTVSSGGTITSGQGTRELVVLWNTAGTHTISVTYCNNLPDNKCCAGTPTLYTQVVNEC